MSKYALPLELVGVALIVAGIAVRFGADIASIVAGVLLVAVIEVRG